MPEIIINELGQKVRVYEWEEYQRRISNRRPWKGQGDLNGKILLISHTWGIGDVLYSTPAVRGLKQKFPDVRIHYICTCPEILENNPDIERIYHWMDHDSLTSLSDELDDKKEEWYWLDYDTPLKGGYDYKIHLRTKPQLNEYLLSLLKKDPKGLRGDERDFVNQASNAVITRYRMVALDMYCWHAYVDPPNKTVHYYPYDHELQFARDFLAPLRKKKFKPIVLIPSSSTLYKNYPHWKEVIRLCPYNYYWIVLDAFGRGEAWSAHNMMDCSGAFKLRLAAAVVIESDLCCSSDTGLLYTKAARGGKCIVLYGPHNWEPFLHYFQPQARGLRVEYVTGLLEDPCCATPCYIDSVSCKGGGQYSPCLDQLSPQAVASAIQEHLESKS